MLKERIETSAAGMTQIQTKIAAYLLEHLQEAAFQVAAQLAKEIGVSEASLVRLSKYLGFASYGDFKQAAYEEFIAALSTTGRLNEIPGKKEKTQNESSYSAILQRDMDAIQSAQKNVSPERIDELAEAIVQAPVVYIAAVRGSSVSALHLYYHLSWILPNIKMLPQDYPLEILSNAPEGSLVIGIDFPRYVNWTISVLKNARELGLKVACITDSLNSPFAEYSHIMLTVPYRTISFVDSCTCVISVINCIIMAVSARRQHEVKERLQQLETLWQKANIYSGNSRTWLAALSG